MASGGLVTCRIGCTGTSSGRCELEAPQLASDGQLAQRRRGTEPTWSRTKNKSPVRSHCDLRLWWRCCQFHVQGMGWNLSWEGQSLSAVRVRFLGFHVQNRQPLDVFRNPEIPNGPTALFACRCAVRPGLPGDLPQAQAVRGSRVPRLWTMTSHFSRPCVGRSSSLLRPWLKSFPAINPMDFFHRSGLSIDPLLFLGIFIFNPFFFLLPSPPHPPPLLLFHICPSRAGMVI